MARSTVKKPKTVTVGDRSVTVSRGTPRTVSRSEGTKTTTLATGKRRSVQIKQTKSADATGRNRIGAYARAHATTNDDGSTTYEKKAGGTVTRSVSLVRKAKPAADKPNLPNRPSNNGGAPAKDRRPKLPDGQHYYDADPGRFPRKLADPKKRAKR